MFVCDAFLAMPIFTNKNKRDDRIMIQICLSVGRAHGDGHWVPILSQNKSFTVAAPVEISLSDVIWEVIKRMIAQSSHLHT